MFVINKGTSVSFDCLCQGCGNESDQLYQLKYPPVSASLSDYREVVFCEDCWQQIWKAFSQLDVSKKILERRNLEKGRRSTND